MRELSEKLVKSLFTGSAKEILNLVKPLDEKQRKELYKNLEPVLKTLRQACKYNYENSFVITQTKFAGGGMTNYAPRFSSLDDVYRLVAENFDQLEEYFKKEKVNFFAAENSKEFFQRLNILHVAICNKKEIYKGLKFNRNDYIGRLDEENKTETFLYNAGVALMERPEEWNKEVFVKLFDNAETWLSDLGKIPGFAMLVKNILEKKPEWRSELKPYTGKAMFYDGLFESPLETYSSEMILDGLEYDKFDEKQRQSFFYPVSESYKQLTELVKNDYLERNRLIDIIIKNLLVRTRPYIVKTWLEFYEFLNLTEDEIISRTEKYIDLLNAPSPQVQQLALREIKKIITVKNSEIKKKIILTLGYNFSSSVKKVARESFNLLKTIVKSEKTLLANALEIVGENLYIPDQNLRIDIFKWLKTIGYDTLSNGLKTKLSELYNYEGLAPLEKEALKGLLPDTPVISQPIAEEISQQQELASITEVKAQYRKNFENITQLLDSFSSSGGLKAQPLVVHDYSIYKSGKKLALPVNAEEVAVSFNRGVSVNFSEIDYEYFLNSVLQFRDFDKNKTEKILDPVLKKLQKWNEQSEDWPMNSLISDLFLGLIAYMWLNSGEMFEVGKQSRAAKMNWLQFISPVTYNQYRHTALLLKNNISFMLSTPVYQNGWITPEVFSERLLKLPAKLIDENDLFLALLRLPPVKEERLTAWELIKDKLNSYPEPVKNSVILALGDETAFRASVKYYLDYFAKNPPEDVILYKNHSGFINPDGNTEKPLSMDFALFNAALRSRFGDKDALPDIPELSNLNLDRLSINTGLDYSVYTRSIEAFINGENLEEASDAQSEKEFLDKLAGESIKIKTLKDFNQGMREIITAILFSMPAITREQAEGKKYQGLVDYDPKKSPYFPQLLPYLYLTPYFQPGYGFGYNEDEYTVAHVFKFPALARHLFEAGAARLKEELQKYDFSVSLLGMGIYPYVTISKHVPELLSVFRSKHPHLREKISELVFEALKEGRITITEFAKHFSRLISETGAGFKYLTEAIQDLYSYGPLLEKILLLSFEEVLAGEPEKIKAQNLSVLLALYYDLLAKYARIPENSKAKENIETMAAAKKKNIIKDKASLLLNLKTKNRQPLLVEIWQEIISYSGQG